jgi:two-component system, sensor histidine kinase and response regulator
MEEIVHESEACLRSIVETAVDAILTVNKEGIIQTANRATEQMFGYASAELIGKNLAILIPEPYATDHNSYIRNYLATGQAKVIGVGRETLGKRKDGTTFAIDLAVSEFRSGENVYFTGIIRDINPRKISEQRVATEHALSKILAESPAKGEATVRILSTLCLYLGWSIGELFIVDENTNFLRCDGFWALPSIDAFEFEQVTRSISFAPGEGLPGRIWQRKEPVWIANICVGLDSRRVIFAEKEGLRSAFGFPLKREEEIFGVMCFFSHALLPPDENLLETVDAIADQVAQFLQRKQIEEALKISEFNYREIFNVAKEAIFVHDADTGEILDVNASMCEMYGCTVEEARRLNVNDLSAIDPEYSQERALKRIHAAVEGNPQQFEWKARNVKDGHAFWVEVTLKRANVRGKERLLAVVRNIDDRKRLEEELDCKARELRLFEEKLRQTEKLTIMGMLASEIAHEVGTPLNIVLGRIELLRNRESCSSKSAADFNIIEQQIERIRKIIDMRLSITRKVAGRVSTIRIRELCDYLIELFHVQLSRGKIKIESQLPEDLVLQFDEDELQQVLLNLLVNAMQAMKQGGKITICGRQFEVEGNRQVEISIHDTGSGISPENLERIFDPFFSTKKEQGGTGLGLAVVYNIVKRAGGEIDVQSELNQGTQFKIQLPATRHS